MFQSFKIAFSMYSKIPMSRVEWTKENFKYVMCFFPMIGIVIGSISVLVCMGLEKVGVGLLLKGSILTIIPIIMSGGIHMEGFLDTIDAKSSYKDKQEKLNILKDPHAGAFAIIGCMVYGVLSIAMYSEVTRRTIGIIAIGYVYERALSALSVVSFQKATSDGTVATFSQASDKKKVKMTLYVFLIICILGMIWIHPVYGSVSSMVGIVVFFSYKKMAYRIFGGVTGDLAGYFLQVCELAILSSVVLVNYLLPIMVS